MEVFVADGKKKKRILILDDSPIEVRFMRDAMVKVGPDIEFTHETDAISAFNMLASGDDAPDLFLLDLRMPVISGLEFLALMAEKGGRKMPVVVMSNSADPNDISAARRLGADDFITKPHSLEGYLQVAEDLLDNWFDGDKADKATYH